MYDRYWLGFVLLCSGVRPLIKQENKLVMCVLTREAACFTVASYFIHNAKGASAVAMPVKQKQNISTQ